MTFTFNTKTPNYLILKLYYTRLFIFYAFLIYHLKTLFYYAHFYYQCNTRQKLFKMNELHTIFFQKIFVLLKAIFEQKTNKTSLNPLWYMYELFFYYLGRYSVFILILIQQFLRSMDPDNSNILVYFNLYTQQPQKYYSGQVSIHYH